MKVPRRQLANCVLVGPSAASLPACATGPAGTARAVLAPGLLAALLALAACQSAPPVAPAAARLAAAAPQPGAAAPPTTLAAVGEYRPGSGYANGYLPRTALPDSLALLPPPPPPGTPLAEADLLIHRATRSLRDSPRWALAARDANLKFPGPADTFACTLGLPITEPATPHLNMLLRRTLLDAGLATYAAKDKYKRLRPFVALKEEICVPADVPSLTNDGSYPSGHAALGWAWALVLAELAPEQAQALLMRGVDFGQSRVVCGVHWQSDVDAGRMIGAAAVARLHADPLFTAQMALAKSEIAAARQAGVKADAACAAGGAR